MQQTLFLESGCYYHIYNRGTNKDTIFYEKRDYDKFFELWEKYIDSIVDTYAFCLIPNHFHYLIRVKDLAELKKVLPVTVLDEKQQSLFISRQFSNMFNAYAKYFNIKYNRVGKLFCERFKRKVVMEEDYMVTLICYIHANPVKHGLVDDHRDYEYSSYWHYILDQPTRLKKDEVLSWFGSKINYELAHF